MPLPDPSVWVKTHKPEAALAAGGVVLSIYLYKKSKGAGAASGLSTVPASGIDPTQDPGFAAGPPSGTAPSASNWTIPSGIKRSGSGFVVPGSAGEIETSPSGSSYEFINNKAEFKAATAAGEPLFYQPTPGVFESIKGKKLIGGTPLFVKVK